MPRKPATTMQPTIDYYFAPQSPWVYLGHARFAEIAQAANARVEVRPVDLGRVFSVSGGLPLGQRAPQRQAYRLVELERFSRELNQPLHLHPEFFPVAGDPAALLIAATALGAGTAAAMKLTGAILAAVWREERNIADAAVLAALLDECALDAALAAQAQSDAARERYEADTRRAIDVGVFGAPSYVIDGEIFWGQDRLDFLERALERTRSSS